MCVCVCVCVCLNIFLYFIFCLLFIIFFFKEKYISFLNKYFLNNECKIIFELGYKTSKYYYGVCIEF